MENCTIMSNPNYSRLMYRVLIIRSRYDKRMLGFIKGHVTAAWAWMSHGGGMRSAPRVSDTPRICSKSFDRWSFCVPNSARDANVLCFWPAPFCLSIHTHTHKLFCVANSADRVGVFIVTRHCKALKPRRSLLSNERLIHVWENIVAIVVVVGLGTTASNSEQWAFQKGQN